MRRKAQSLIEYSVFICVIAAALVAMQVYIKRSIQGRVKSSADELGGGFGYSPGATSANNLTSRNITEHALSYSEGTSVSEIKKSITESTSNIHQSDRREEETLPLGAEPRR